MDNLLIFVISIVMPWGSGFFFLFLSYTHTHTSLFFYFYAKLDSQVCQIKYSKDPDFSLIARSNVSYKVCRMHEIVLYTIGKPNRLQEMANGINNENGK